MKALTLWQPWASLIASGAKTLEIRGRNTNYRGELAIHAAKRPYRASDAHTVADLPYGAFVCLVDLYACFAAGKGDEGAALCPILLGDYAWVVKVLRTFKPIPADGKQGFWTVDAHDSGELLLSPHVEPATKKEIEAVVDASHKTSLIDPSAF